MSSEALQQARMALAGTVCRELNVRGWSRG